MSNEKVIDLRSFARQDSIVMSGRPRGKDIRAQLKLDTEDNLDSQLIVRIPDEIISINSSFFLGLFGPSVRHLGEEKFNAKYRFECRDEVRVDIKRGIRHAIERSNPLGH